MALLILHVQGLCPVPDGKPSHLLEEPHSSHLYPQPCAFNQYPRKGPFFSLTPSPTPVAFSTKVPNSAGSTELEDMALHHLFHNGCLDFCEQKHPRGRTKSSSSRLGLRAEGQVSLRNVSSPSLQICQGSCSDTPPGGDQIHGGLRPRGL